MRTGGDNNQVSLAACYTRALSKYRGIRWGVVAFTIAIFMVAVWAVPGFLTNTEISQTPPKGSAAYTASKALVQNFPDRANEDSVDCIITARAGASVLGAPLQEFQRRLRDDVAHFQESNCNNTDFVHLPQNFLSHTTFSDARLHVLARHLVAANNTMTIMSMRFAANSPCSGPFHDWLKAHMRHLTKGTHLEVSAVSRPYLKVEALEGITSDLIKIDSISCPLVLMVMWRGMGNWRMVVLPMVSVLVATAASFSIMWPVALCSSVVAFAPSIMLSIIVALSVDYSLFMASRYKEEMARTEDVEEAVARTVHSAGHMVMVSGMIFAACSLCSTWHRHDQVLFSFGIGGGLAAITCVFASVVILPTLLLLFPRFFSGRTRDPTSRGASSEATSYELTETASFRTSVDGGCIAPAAGDSQEVELKELHACHVAEPREVLLNHEHCDSSGYVPGGAERPETNTITFRLCRMVVSHPWRLMTIISVLLILPACVYIPSFQLSYSFLDAIPRYSESTRTIRSVEQGWGSGQIFNYNLIFVSKGDKDVMTLDFFRQSQDVLKAIYDLDPQTPPKIQGILWHDDGPTLHRDVELAMNLNCGDPLVKCKCSYIYRRQEQEICAAQVAYHSLVSHNQTAAVMDVENSFSAQGSRGHEWLMDVRRLVAAITVNFTLPMEVHVQGFMAETIDRADTAFRLGFVVFVAMGAVAFAIQVLVFRSLFLAVTSVLSIALTTLAVFGVMVGIYVRGILNCTGWASVASGNGVYWAIPLIAIPMIVGLGVDYNVFLVTRVIEYRRMGYSNAAAVMLGLSKTSPVITAAGLIMLIAFGSLLLSSLTLLNQLGMILTLAVFLDTFVVRTILTPVSMVVAGEFTYWPAKMPTPTKFMTDSSIVEPRV